MNIILQKENTQKLAGLNGIPLGRKTMTRQSDKNLNKERRRILS